MTSLTIAGLPITAGGLPGVAWSAAGAGRQPAITAMYSAIRWIVIDGHSAVGGDCRTVDAGYTDAVALDLGLKQPATPGLPPDAVPEFSLRLTTGGKLEVVWHKGKSEGVKLQFNLGAAGMQDDIDLRPNYTLNWLPAVGQSAVIQVRLAFLLKDGGTGSWSDWKQFTLTGA